MRIGKRVSMVVVEEDSSVRLELSLEIAADAQRASQEFWRTWLWQSREMQATPTPSFCTAIADRFGVSAGEVCRQWHEWYGLLTSWDLAAALVGRDVRISAPAYGASHRRL